MKNLTWFYLGTAVVSMVACGVKDRGSLSAQYAKTANNLNQKQAVDQAVCVPGKAGTISINDVLLKSNDSNKPILDDRIITISADGKALNATTAPTPTSNQFKVGAAPDEKVLHAVQTLSNATTFLNLGCDVEKDLPTATKTWKEVKAGTADGKISTEALNISANSVFICGDQKINSLMVNLSADNLIFLRENSSLSLAEGNLATFSIIANKITLKGENKIAIKAKDAVSFNDLSYSLNIYSISPLEGTGKLTLSATGGSCTKADIDPKDLKAKSLADKTAADKAAAADRAAKQQIANDQAAD